ncbi:HmuY family protein [Comamonas flocculans]|uniref:Heme-binding HmuY-like protein n=1 Tax=Comamonas flocculans TaxID=2597701 RepID=A0A5B8RTG1_9BURK|nr:HmuY family protein [Comamonas flocculans]QEA12836.1 hypothetical protein FOZ74_07240 [Comamonas flocculans]
MKRKPLAITAAALASALLAACGGGSDDTPAPEPTPTSAFTKSASWKFVLPDSGGSVCYDFDAGAEVAGCAGSAWDVKVTSGGRSATLWTNSGTSGPGKGGAFGGPFDHTWTALSVWKDATIDPVDGALPDAVYFKDSVHGAFTGGNAIASAAFEYDLKGDHQLYPNYRVFLVTSDSSSADATGTPAAPVYALQVTGYYGGPTGVASGYVSLRWVDRADPANVRTATVDARSDTDWAYLDLQSGTITSASGPWHIAFNRYNIKLNGGDSGSGKVAGFVGKTPAGFYGADGQPVVERFASAKPADTLADLTAADIAVPAAANKWVADSFHSLLGPDYRGAYPNPLDFGWYSYYPTEAGATAVGLHQHMLKPNPEAATLVRSGEGNSYARMHVTDIAYAPADPPYAGAQTWTIAFDVQPPK